MGFFGAPLAEIPENSTFAVPKGKISRKTQRSGRAVFPIAIGSTGLENQNQGVLLNRGVVERFIAPVLKTGDVKASGGSNPSSSAESPDFVGAFFGFKNR
jgi:hypothetical protein